MQRLKHLKKAEISTNEFNNIFGGTEISTCYMDDICDIHYDDNDDGIMNPGECMDIVKCETDSITQ